MRFKNPTLLRVQDATSTIKAEHRHIRFQEHHVQREKHLYSSSHGKKKSASRTYTSVAEACGTNRRKARVFRVPIPLGRICSDVNFCIRRWSDDDHRHIYALSTDNFPWIRGVLRRLDLQRTTCTGQKPRTHIANNTPTDKNISAPFDDLDTPASPTEHELPFEFEEPEPEPKEPADSPFSANPMLLAPTS